VPGTSNFVPRGTSVSPNEQLTTVLRLAAVPLHCRAPAGPGNAAADPADPLALLLLLVALLLTRLTQLAPLALLLQLLLARLTWLLVLLQAPLSLLPSGLLLVALLRPPAQAQVPGGCCCAQQLLHYLLQVHWHLQQLHCRLPRALLYLRLPGQQTQQRLVLLLALPRCTLLGLQSCSLQHPSQLQAGTQHSAAALGRQALGAACLRRRTAVRCWSGCSHAAAAGEHLPLLLTCAGTASRRHSCMMPAHSRCASGAL
jgi:hypothetical protein